MTFLKGEIYMESYTFRILQKDDIKEFNFIAEVHESLPAAWINNYIIDDEEVKKTIEELVKRHKGSQILCCIFENNDEIIGFIWAEVNEDNSEVVDIISLWTSENYRGQGIATKLKIQLEDWTKNKTNAKKISTTVSAKNKAMLALNQKLGYEINSYKMTKMI